MYKGNELISIIVPMYNVEKYIEKCIISIKDQTYENYEVIIVDDGTKDNSNDKAYCAIGDDERFAIVHKENGGLSSARNHGLGFASGEYITFIDSDDHIGKDYLLNLYNAITQHPNCEIAMSRIRYTAENEDIRSNDTKPPCIKVKSRNVAIRKMLLRDKYNHCAYGKLYRSRLWHGMAFPEGRLYEDYLTIYQIFSKVEIVALIDSIDYFYVQHSNSIMHENVSLRILDIINVTNEVTSWIYHNNREVYLPALELQMATYIKTLQKIRNYEKDSFMEFQLEIEKGIKTNFTKILLYRYTPCFDRIKLLLFGINKTLFFSLYDIVSGGE